MYDLGAADPWSQTFVVVCYSSNLELGLPLPVPRGLDGQTGAVLDARLFLFRTVIIWLTELWFSCLFAYP